MIGQSSETRFTFRRRDLLRWLYLGRLTLVTGILLAALLVWRGAEPIQTFLATAMFLAATLLTGASFWYTHIREEEPGDNFVYLQVLFDVVLVTSVVHITQGGDSPFAFLYILVISSGSLLLPLPGGVLVGVLATILFFADTVWLHLETFEIDVLLQMGLFAAVAVITGWLGDRVRRAGLALGEVETALRRLRLDTGDILSSINSGVLTVDAEGRLLYLNPAGETMLGLDRENWMGAPVVGRLDELAPGLGTLLRRSVTESEPVARFKTVAQRDGAEVVLGVSTNIPFWDEAEPQSVTAIFQDITDQERLEALNRRAERLEAVAQLSASLAHEIKNPLSSIRSAVEQLSGGKVQEEDRNLLERLVVKESDRLSRLLSEFIEYSALRMGNTRKVDLAALVRDCLALVRQHPDVGEGVEFKEEGLDRKVLVPGDEDLLHRAAFNLILNAAQFAGPEGTVRLEIRDRNECRAPAGSGMASPVCLRVVDSGPGVDPDNLHRIFDPFFTSRPGGSGLGLALVHRAVEAHEGSVMVEEGMGGGAAFALYLPGEVTAETEEAS